MIFEIKATDLIEILRDSANWNWDSHQIDRVFYHDCEFCKGKGHHPDTWAECKNCDASGLSDQYTLFGDRLLEFIKENTKGAKD